MARPRIVIVGAGFAGFHAARELDRLAGDQAEVVLVNPTDYFLYVPLLPEVAAGIVEPRRITVSLTTALPRVRLVLGEAKSVDVANRAVVYEGVEGGSGRLDYDRLVLAVGEYKRKHGLAVYDPERERALLEKLCKAAPPSLDHDTVRRIFERLIDESRRIEQHHVSGR